MFGRSLNKYTSNERKPVQIFPWVEKKNKSPSCPQVKQFFSETSVLMCSETSVSHMVFGEQGPFLVTTSSTFEGSKKALLFCHTGIFRVHHICNETCPHQQKKNEASTQCCFWKTNLKMTVERRQNHLRQSQLIFQKTFRTLPQKWRNFQGCLFFLLWVEAQNEIGRNSFRNDWC